MGVLLAEACIASCDGDHRKQEKAILSAPPGQFATVIGTGPEGSPESSSGWFEDPIDLTAAPGGGILVLTKTNGRVFVIRPDGSHLQEFSLPVAGDALSIETQPDGTVIVAEIVRQTGKLAIWRRGIGQSANIVEQQSAPNNIDGTHLVRAPDGKVMLLKDGWLQEESASGAFKPMRRPKGMTSDADVLAAATDGDTLMLLLPAEIIWLNNDRVIRRLPIAEMDAHDGATITSDGSGGAFMARYGPAIEHYSSQGKNGTVLLGYGGITGCGKGNISGITGSGRDQNFSKATSLLNMGKQLYFADPECHRVLTIGLPPKEYAS